MPKTMLPEAVDSLVEQFNQMYPIGTPVLLIEDFGEVTKTRTKWPAENRYGQATIGVEAKAGAWNFDRIIPIAATKSEPKRGKDDQSI